MTGLVLFVWFVLSLVVLWPLHSGLAKRLPNWLAVGVAGGIEIILSVVAGVILWNLHAG